MGVEEKLAQENTEKLFKLIDESVMLLKQSLSSSYLDAFIESADNIIAGEVQVEDGKPTQEIIKQLNQIYAQIDLDNTDAETIRTVIQLSMLKAVKQDAIQPNHQMTPDTLGFLIAYIIEKIGIKQDDASIFDLSVGTGNLLTTVMNHLKQTTGKKIHGYGIDNDDSMLAVASVSVEMQQQDIELYHQDAIDSLDIPQCDYVVSDLPVGYYPLDNNTDHYETRAEKGHSYVHHLLIEQAMNYLKPGGFGVFLIPSDLFKTDESKQFVEWIQRRAHLQGLVNLPSELFQTKQAEKSILLLQRRGTNSHQAPKVLLGQFPSFKKKTEFANFMVEINNWVKTNLKG